jgi:transitional endoplasmic reticulum ATPase
MLRWMRHTDVVTAPEWVQKFDRHRQAGVRAFILTFNTNDFVFVPSEPERSSRPIYFLAQKLADEGYAVYGFSFGRGLFSLMPPNARQRLSMPNEIDGTNPELVLRWLTRQLQQLERKVAVIVDYADHLVPNAQGLTSAVLQPQQLVALEILHGWANSDAIRQTDNLVILLSHENQVHDLLMRSGSGYIVLQIPLPDFRSRLAFVQHLLQEMRIGQLEDDLAIEEFAHITGGLRLVDIHELLTFSDSTGQKVTRDMVRERKADTIRQLCQDLVSVVEPTCGFEGVAGLQHAVEYFRWLVWQVRSGSENVPQAILLAGVPGCGKSYIVSALGKELGFLVFKLGTIRERWVGASERNLERVLWVAETLAPVLIWVDEIDQTFGGQRSAAPSADAGTSERLIGRIWDFMGSMRYRGKILWVATTNRPDLLDAATVDRFQVVIPFLHPTRKEIAALLPILAKQVGRVLAEDIDSDKIASIPSLRLPTVRALQEVIGVAGVFADAETGQPGTTIHQRHLLRAAHEFKPNYNPLVHEFIALTAIRMTSFNFLLPWRTFDGRRRTDYELPEYLKGIVDETSGEVDLMALHRRLSELRRVVDPFSS